MLQLINVDDNLIDKGHSIDTNYRMWQNHKWIEGEWSPSQEWQDDFANYFTKAYGKKFDTVLEIGIGIGKWVPYLQEIAGKYIGIDLTDISIEICNKNFSQFPNVQFFKNDGKTLPMVADGSVDFIWSYDVFVHISPHDIRDYIKEFSRVMKKGSVAVIHHGRGESRAGWRSTLTNKMFDSFLDEFGLIKIDQVEKWLNYEVIHEDSITIFTK